MHKIAAEDKIYYCEQYLAGKMTQGQIANLANVKKSSVYNWIIKYESMGSDAFLTSGYKSYSAELKLLAVNEYLSGTDSMYGICRKYGIHSHAQLSRWILKYNNSEELKASGTGGYTIMTRGRKTTFNERIEIVQYCIAHSHNYAETAQKYQISYQQARNYTIKYETGGVEMLQDNRGKRKTADQMSELERLRAENKLLRAEKDKIQMEMLLLKKLEEIERRRD